MGTTVLSNSIRWTPNRHKFCKLLGKAMTNKLRNGEVARGILDRMFVERLNVTFCRYRIFDYIRKLSGPEMPGPLHSTFWRVHDK